MILFTTRFLLAKGISTRRAPADRVIPNHEQQVSHGGAEERRRNSGTALFSVSPLLRVSHRRFRCDHGTFGSGTREDFRRSCGAGAEWSASCRAAGAEIHVTGEKA